MYEERVELSEEEQLPDTERDEEGKKKRALRPLGLHGHHLFVVGRCVPCGEPQPTGR
jgi:hypothetical protein